MYYRIEKDYICHHGVKGQRWGIRRFRKKQQKTTNEKKKKHRFLKAALTVGLTISAIYGAHRILTTTPSGKKFINDGKKVVGDIFNLLVLSNSVKNTQPKELQPEIDPAVFEQIRKMR